MVSPTFNMCGHHRCLLGYRSTLPSPIVPACVGSTGRSDSRKTGFSEDTKVGTQEAENGPCANTSSVNCGVSDLRTRTLFVLGVPDRQLLFVARRISTRDAPSKRQPTGGTSLASLPWVLLNSSRAVRLACGRGRQRGGAAGASIRCSAPSIGRCSSDWRSG